MVGWLVGHHDFLKAQRSCTSRSPIGELVIFNPIHKVLVASSPKFTNNADFSDHFKQEDWETEEIECTRWSVREMHAFKKFQTIHARKFNRQIRNVIPLMRVLIVVFKETDPLTKSAFHFQTFCPTSIFRPLLFLYVCVSSLLVIIELSLLLQVFFLHSEKRAFLQTE